MMYRAYRQNLTHFSLSSLLSQCFQKYGIYDLAVVENAQYGYLSLNLENMPVNIDWPDTIPKKGEGIFLRFTDINVVPKEVFPYVANMIKQINIVMKSANYA